MIISFPLTVAAGLGRKIKPLTKQGDAALASAATDVIAVWKAAVLAQLQR